MFIEALNAYIDPIKPVDKAIITHAHADHAKPNHNKVLATKDTINIEEFIEISMGKCRLLSEDDKLK